MPRHVQGGAFEARGKHYMRVNVSGERTAELLPWMTAELWTAHDGKAKACPCAGCVRARLVQGWVTRVIDAGKANLLAPETLIREAAKCTDPVELAAFGEAVDRVIGTDTIRKVEPKAPSGSIDKVTDTWLDSVEALYDETTHHTLGVYAAKWPAFFGETIDRIDSPALARFLAVRLGQVTRSTVKKELWGLRSFVTWLVEVAQLIPTMPPFPKVPKRATGVRVGRQREKAVELTVEQKDALISTLSAVSRPRYEFMRETGLRPETIDKLKEPEHYVRGSGVLKITADIDKARYARTVPISERARAILDAQPVRKEMDSCSVRSVGGSTSRPPSRSAGYRRRWRPTISGTRSRRTLSTPPPT
jgi:integrase